MNQSIDIASNVINNPPKELQDLMNDPRTSPAARAAVSDVASVTSPLKSSATLDGATKSNKTEDGRLQVVDENQEFT